MFPRNDELSFNLWPFSLLNDKCNINKEGKTNLLSNAEERRVGVPVEGSDQKMWEVLDVFLLGSLILLCLTVFVTIFEFILDKIGAIKVTYSGLYLVFGIILAADLLIFFISAKWMKQLEKRQH